jgi:hypothetical protein
MVNMMNEQHKDIPLDADLQKLDAQLQDAMPVTPRAELATRIYRATVADLPQSPVIARIGWSSWAGWRYAAAIAVVFFYSVLWIKPHVMPTIIPQSDVAMTMHAVTQDPVLELDEQIDQVAAQIDELATDFEAGPTNMLDWRGDDTLAEQLLQFDDQLGTAG